MRRRLRHLLALAGACSALALGACGSSEDPEGDPLPAASVSDIENRLDEIQRRYDDAVEDGNLGACNQINSDSLKAIREIIAGLPEGVDADVRDAVKEGFARLGELADQECAALELEPEPRPEPVPVPVPVPEPEETETEETPTAPTDPDPKPEKDKEKKEKPDKGSGGIPPPENPNSNGGGVEAPGLEGGG